ncbi:hypothetical protein [Mycobacterium sp. PSTR-4-N]|uniref:hypothetical protein n=1 Tax=Mycobacterium sp. PSTR-4-N TaxID=2917745 RepID=UPI001F1519CF|nr:hypothetical protein [Mycobacterium sp. PSTR-4-N]MCG7596365.1 hypothetical protein [Mycobacterium sp. PSTR-4-N]
MTAAVLDHPKADFWRQELDSGAPYRQAKAAEGLAEAFSLSDTEVRVTVHDSFWREIGPAGDFIELTGSIPRNAAPQATLKLKENHWLDPYLSQCETTMVGVRIQTEGLDEAFYVKGYTEELGKDGTVTLTAELVGIWDILNYLPIWPSSKLPIQTQPFSDAIYFSPLCTVIEGMAAEQALRIQGGLNEFINNALSLNADVRAWLGTMLQAIKNDAKIGTALKTPLYVVRTGLLTDTSPLYCRTVRMETVGQVIADITKAYGVDVRIYLWLPGMEQPDKWANLDRPTYVMRVLDRSQIQGPTQTVLDSAVRFAVDVQGSLLGKTLDPLLNPDGVYAPEGVYIAPGLGLTFVPPYVQLETPDTIVVDGEVVRVKSPLMTYKIKRTTPLGWQHVIGGKSPKWLVCAPPGNWWGTDQLNIERPHERDLLVRDRCSVHHPRIHRRPLEFARRVPQRRVFRLPAHPALQPPRRGGPVSPRHRGLHRHQQQPLQRRKPVPVHPSALGQ